MSESGRRSDTGARFAPSVDEPVPLNGLAQTRKRTSEPYVGYA